MESNIINILRDRTPSLEWKDENIIRRRTGNRYGRINMTVRLTGTIISVLLPLDGPAHNFAYVERRRPAEGWQSKKQI